MSNFLFFACKMKYRVIHKAQFVNNLNRKGVI